MRKLLIIIFSLCLGTISAMHHRSDTLKRVYVTGTFYKVSGRHLVPLQNSTVYIKGTRINSVSDQDGKYSLDVTVIADTARTITVSGYLENHEAREYIVNKPLTKNVIVNFELQPVSTAVYNKVSK
jgi:hypothetical protein